MIPRIERYEIEHEIGHGGMATVYRARDSRLDRPVAIKVMHPHLRGTEQARARFAREARAVARLKHPSILEIYDYSGHDSEVAYIATELLTGPTLKGFMESVAEVPAEIVACIGVELSRALSAAHAEGIIHRDVKPENVLLHEARVVKLTDFGIADMLDPSMSAMTATGQLLGSPAHMAPEQVEGGETDARSDIFSVGTILYWLSTGSLPFSGKNPHQVLKRVVDCTPADPLLLRPSIGSDLRAIIMRCLAKAPADRYPSADALAVDLEAYLKDLGLERPRDTLSAYLRDPESEAQRLNAHVCEALLRRAQEAINQRNRPRAIALIDRVLALQDGHPEALRLLDTLDRAARKRLTTRIALSAGLLALVAGLCVAFVPRSDAARGLAAGEPAPASSVEPVAKSPQPVPEPATPAAPEPGVVAEPQQAQPAQERQAPSPPTTNDARRPRPSRERPVASTGSGDQTAPRTVRFDPEPANVSISVDNEAPRHFGPSFRMVDLAPGRHSFKFIGAHDCCEDRIIDMEVPPGPGESVVSVKLPFRPARVYVVSAVPADVEIDDGAAVGRTRSLINVPVERSYIERRRISVTAPGHEAYTGTIQLRAGQVTQLDVALKPSAAP